KDSYDPQTGQMSGQPNIMAILENFWLPQCLSLQTSIPLLNGEDKTLSEIIDDYNNGIRNEVYSVDQKTGKILKGDVE
ncbi:MAG: portal protein, partial [Bacillota bacterium]